MNGSTFQISDFESQHRDREKSMKFISSILLLFVVVIKCSQGENNEEVCKKSRLLFFSFCNSLFGGINATTSRRRHRNRLKQTRKISLALKYLFLVDPEESIFHHHLLLDLCTTFKVLQEEERRLLRLLRI